MEYWYKYRDDLWKRVQLLDHGPVTHHGRRQDPEERLQSNIRRAARMIEAYALCNPWEWFGTFTLDKRYRDRADLDGFRRDFMQFLRDCRKECGTLAALLVPELHKSKDGWHMHGLLHGLPVDMLRPFTLEERLPNYIRGKLQAGERVYDWPRYRKSFGYVDVEPVRSRDAAARYITKYITKTAEGTAEALDTGKHLYYITRGLAQPELVLQNESTSEGVLPEVLAAGDLVIDGHYSFDYGEVTWLKLPPQV